MPSWIDGSLYPDTPVPDSLDTLEDRVDFLARLCGAWDFGILPESRITRDLGASGAEEEALGRSFGSSPAEEGDRGGKSAPRPPISRVSIRDDTVGIRAAG